MGSWEPLCAPLRFWYALCVQRRSRMWKRLGILALTVSFLVFIPSPAPATIAEQRARLPPPAECGDDHVTGIWRSHQWDPIYRDWTIFTLRITRDPTQSEHGPERLVGLITNHSWDATAQDEEPPPCQPGRSEWIVSMDAQGTVSPGGDIAFGGVGRWRLDRVICFTGPGGYNLDNFTGRIDPALNEFQSVNNDGGRAVDHPTVFRRIRCLSNASQAPRVTRQPPEFYPPQPRVGCSL